MALSNTHATAFAFRLPLLVRSKRQELLRSRSNEPGPGPAPLPEVLGACVRELFDHRLCRSCQVRHASRFPRAPARASRAA